MIQRKSLIAMAITAALAAPVALAQTGSTPPAKQPGMSSEGSAPAARNPTDRTANPGAGTFHSFDTNRDGFVSRDEAKNSSELNRQFNELDKDRDGKLSAQELSGWRGAGSPSAASSPMGEGKVGASGSSGVGSSTEPSGGVRDSGKAPPDTKRGY